MYTPDLLYNSCQQKPTLTLEAPNTTIAEFANTVDLDWMTRNEPSHLDLQCLPSSLFVFSRIGFELKKFLKFCRCYFVVCFLGALRIKSA